MSDYKRDQDLAGMRDGLPRFWWAIYCGCMEAGFNEKQSFALLETFIVTQNQYGVKPPDPPMPTEENNLDDKEN
jgi:hypothetical protein